MWEGSSRFEVPAVNFPSTFGLFDLTAWSSRCEKNRIYHFQFSSCTCGCIYTKAANWISPLICKHFKIRVPTNISQTCIKSKSNKWFLVSPLIPLWFSDFDHRLPSSSKSPLLTAAKSNKYLSKKPNTKKEDMEKRWEKMRKDGSRNTLTYSSRCLKHICPGFTSLYIASQTDQNAWLQVLHDFCSNKWRPNFHFSTVMPGNIPCNLTSYGGITAVLPKVWAFCKYFLSM